MCVAVAVLNLTPPPPSPFVAGACRKVFSAGASYFGVADAGLLAKHTHKFESR
jgi:hypothetical protein